MKSSHSQYHAIVYAALMFMIAIIMIQIWLLMSTLETYLASTMWVAGPAALISGICFIAQFGIVKLLLGLDKR